MKSPVSNFRRHTIPFVIADILAITFSMFVSVIICHNFDMNSLGQSGDGYSVCIYLPINILLTFIIFSAFRLYRSVWSFASVPELILALLGCTASAAMMVVISSIVDILVGHRLLVVPHPAYYFLYAFLLIACVCGIRFGYRFMRIMKSTRSGDQRSRVMIVGAGSAGSMLISDITSSGTINKKVVCVIDDNPEKKGRYLKGAPIVGPRSYIPEAAEKYRVDEIFLAIPSAPKEECKQILDICARTKIPTKVLPGMYQLVNGEVSVGQLRDVEIADLLGREQIRPDYKSITEYISDKVVMVTGGGGSIGSELCRQIAESAPRRLIIVDIYENNAYDIQQELRRKHPDLDLVVLIASVRNTRRINKIFETYRPQIVYHAAAHKHVPLMEISPNEAIKNNVFGTLKTVRAADRYKVERFVQISTDKAVNPTNVMGATKRICEMIIQAYSKRSKTKFTAVRFGNVFGSNGSVVPLFKKQIAEGGPVLVTHPEITRFFMTIPEAVSLVLASGAYAKGGEIFVLDMGKPVKILDLATNMIRLSGYTPGVDIEIQFTGLRPGEKLYEELLMDEEGLQKTENNLIYIGKPIEMDDDRFLARLDELYGECLTEPDNIKVKEIISELVPTYAAGGGNTFQPEESRGNEIQNRAAAVVRKENRATWKLRVKKIFKG